MRKLAVVLVLALLAAAKGYTSEVAGSRAVANTSVTGATILTPAPQSTLTGASATFTWTSASGATAYSIYIGTTSGAHDIDYVNAGSNTSASVSNLPTNGQKIFVTLNSLIGGKWYANVYYYYALGSGAAATMSSPAAGSKLPSASATFTWTTGTGISSYSLYIGTTIGAHDIDFVSTSSTSATLTNLPVNGETFYVRLYSLNGKNWLSNNYTYVASGTGTPALMTSPVAGSTLPGANATFQWTAGAGVTSYSLYLGTTAGAHDIDFISAGKSLSASVTNIPQHGGILYVTLYSLIGGAWQSQGYRYLTSGTPVLASIAVTPANSTFANFTSQQMIATGLYTDNSTRDLTNSAAWSSSNLAAATVGSTTGLASGIAPGVSTATATVGTFSGSTSVNVTAATIVSITVSPLTASLGTGGALPYTAIGTFSDNSQQDITSQATWTTSPTGVASMVKGVATGVAAGTTTISAAFRSVTGTANLVVSSGTLSSITVRPLAPSIAAGTAQQFVATGHYSDFTTADLTNTTAWSSDTPSVATISSSNGSRGLASSTSAGTATITATSNSVPGMSSLTVTSATLTSISLTPLNPSVAVGKTLRFVATGTFSDNTRQDISNTVLWTSSKPAVAVMSNAAGSKGLATPVTAGTTTIAAVSGLLSAQTTLTVPVTYSVSGTVTKTGPAPLAGVGLSLTGGAWTTTDSNGNYTFMGVTNGTYTITPTLGGYTLSPMSLSATVSGANLTGKNFSASAATCPTVSGAQTLEINPGAGPSLLSANSPDGLFYLGGGSTFNATPGTFVVNTSSSTNTNTFFVASVGPVCGVGGINSVPTSGYKASQTLQVGYGYVGTIGDGSYIRFYVTSAVAGPVIDIAYEYPMTICAPHTHLVFGDKSTFNGVPSSQYPQSGGYAFVGCKGTATVQAWGGGGGGGEDTISFYGGNGGGGGGGGGYGQQNVVMVPGQWYVVSVGQGGGTSFPPPTDTGGTSGFALEAGSSIFTATGGLQGTDASTGTAAGKGGAGGGSNAKYPQAGSQGSDGQTNFNLGLCGGPGAIGPGGAGGGAGGSGGCEPMSPTGPGGGGSGGSQNGGPTPGASGQVVIDF